MDWKIILLLTAFFIYWAYNMAALSVFGVPKSLSMTFYLFKEKREWQKILFPIMMISMAGLLMPVWLEMSEGSDLQFMSFLAAAGIMFTGTVPTFKSSKLEDRVHTISAIVAAVFALLWVIFVANLWYIIIIWLIIVLLIALISNSIKTSLVYWLETIAFMSTFMSIIIYYLR
jgi:hypothetical protein